MSLIELALGFYFACLLVRALIPDEGQTAFNPLYRAAASVTRPALDRLLRAFPRAGRSGPVLLMAIVVLGQGLLYLLSGPPARRFDLPLRDWIFVGSSPLWPWAKTLAFYLVLLFRLLAFAAVVLALKRPEDAYDQLSRLFRAALSWAQRVLDQNRFALPVLLFAVFSAALAAFWKGFMALGLVPDEKMLAAQAGLIAAALLVSLSSAFVWLIVIHALLSWLPLGNWSGPRGDWLAPLTEPLVAPFRRWNLRFGSWDLSPLAAIVALMLGRRLAMILLDSLWRGAMRI